VLLPKQNVRDLDDIPKDVLAEMTVHLIKKVDEILPLVLEPPSDVAPTLGGSGTPSTPPEAEVAH
jgi:ATP-dependent Lon protease